jgi:predicted membrane-bound dolichyl-phosphate-mannose-protein mannosyltransferase
MIAMVYLVYKIRNVKEELNVRTELLWILAVTIIFTLFYAIPLLR